MKYKNCKLILIGTIFLAFLFCSYPDITEPSMANPHLSGTYVPEGLIALWSGTLDTIPDGWVLCDGNGFTPNTSDCFIWNTDGAEDAGATGGDDNHSHSYSQIPLHDHGVSGTTDCYHTHSYNRPSGTVSVDGGPDINPCIDGSRTTGGSSASHSHVCTQTGQVSCATFVTEQILPSFYKLAFIKKISTNPVIPVGIILFWTGTIIDIPQGWAECNGSQSTPDLRGRFVLGVTSENPGASGGNSSHSHTYTDIQQHSHTIASGGNSHAHDARCDTTLVAGDWIGPTVGICRMEDTGYTSIPHTHSMNAVGQSTCETDESSHLPPFTAVAFIMNTAMTTGIPTGCISFWSDTVANIPIGWTQCDGTGDTMDLREKFLKGSSLAEPIGTNGGFLTHTHVYTEVPLHSHTLLSDDMRHRHALYEIYTSKGVWSGGKSVYGGSTSSADTSSRDATHSHDILPAGIASPHTDPESNLPPYLEFIFIQNIAPITSVDWVSPAADSSILFSRALDVRFDFEYSWSGLGNDITLSLTNGTNIHDAGSVMGVDHIFIPYLDGDVDATFHIFQDATELTSATRSFTFYNNRNPTTTLIQPNGGEVLNGTYEVTWSGSDPDGDQIYYTIEFNIEDTGWVEIVSGLTSTTYDWDTTLMLDSESVKLKIIAEDAFGGISSDESDAVFTIDNEPGDGPRIPGYNTWILVSLMLISSVLIAWKRKK